MIKKLLALGLPISLMQFGSASMNIMNTVFVSMYSAEALAVLGGGNGVFWFVQVTLMAFLFPLDGLFSQRNAELTEKNKLLTNAIYVAIAIAALATLVLYLFCFFLFSARDQGLSAETFRFIMINGLSLFPLFCFVVVQKYWQSFYCTRVFSILVLISCMVNFLADYILLSPTFGFLMGAEGVAWATVLSRMTVLVLAVGYSLYKVNQLELKGYSVFGYDRALLGKIMRLGLPSSGHSSLEMASVMLLSYFSIVFGPEAMAANQIALTLGMASFPIYWGVAAAASTYIGGVKAVAGAYSSRDVISATYRISLIISVVAASLLWLLSREVTSFFDVPAEAVELTKTLVMLVALYQIADCFQSVTAGVLRGVSIITPVFISNLVCYYVLGLLVFVFCYVGIDMGYISIWIAFCVGVNASAAVNLWLVKRRFLTLVKI
ncbi:MATE family efflux transporter [Pseudomonas orientalis]|uniref:MATE family efflux transporter n=1 Tax=Pseudomonas orientalis TaxID=76758 RepID=UPI0034D79227